MPTILRFTPLLVAVPLALAACSDGSNNTGGVIRKDAGTTPGDDAGTTPGGDAGTMGGTLDTAQLASTLAAAQCAFYQRCVPAVFVATEITQANCEAMIAADLKPTYDDLVALVDAGRVRYQADQVAACTTELAALDCDLGQLDVSPCNAIFAGAQAEGEACQVSFECTDGTWCSRPNGLGSCGTCAPVAARGASCASAPCGADARCIDIGQNGMSNPTCIPIDAPLDGACLTIQTGLCRGSLRCVGTDTLTCQRPASTAGATCDANDETAPNCDLGRNLACSNGTCATASWGGVGSACGGTSFCSGDAFCPSAMGGTCQGLPALGQSCADVGECATDAYCDSTGTCAPVKPMGSSCTTSAECLGDLVCLGAAGSATCGAYSWSQCN
ncbi:hypothetical protein L6R52_11905 [Myxococcota bacterium]|nr:hypothetical protein [Myxococcota bacterium]